MKNTLLVNKFVFLNETHQWFQLLRTHGNIRGCVFEGLKPDSNVLIALEDVNTMRDLIAEKSIKR